VEDRINASIRLAFAYFTLSALLTCIFVVLAPGYISYKQMIFSTSIAGGKWALQIVLAFFVLNEKKWEFVKNIGFVCFAGSCLLIPYIFLSWMKIEDSMQFFTASLAAAVILMIILYRRAVLKTGISMGWWVCWLACLAVAISLQLTLVFHLL
jgi:hypothetical protein